MLSLASVIAFRFVRLPVAAGAAVDAAADRLGQRQLRVSTSLLPLVAVAGLEDLEVDVRPSARCSNRERSW